jgi:protein subunit release factor A
MENTIQTVKEIRDIDTDQLTGYLINNSMHVPLSEGNRHYKEVQEWIAEGNIPEPAYTSDELENYLNEKHNNEILFQIVQKEKELIRPMRELLSNTATAENKEYAQTKVDEIEPEIQSLRRKLI